MIHVLGAGSIGCLIASNLAKQHPVTLLLRGSTQLDTFKKAGNVIRMDTNGVMLETPVQAATDVTEPISKLVVCTKAMHVRKALEKYAGLLKPESSVLVVHSGMGVYEEIKSLWPPGEHPKFSFAVTTTGVYSAATPYSFTYGGAGTLSVASIETDDPLVQDLVRASSTFTSEELSYPDFVVKQLEKLVINASINTVTAVVGVKSGKAFELDHNGLIAGLTVECCDVLRRSAPAEAAEKVAQVLNPDRMVPFVRDVCMLNPGNVTSMLADVNAGRPTEIDYISGYVVNEAKRMGLNARRNETMVELVKMKGLRNQSPGARVPAETDNA